MSERPIGIVHNEPVPTGQAYSEASLDVLEQVEAIEGVLRALGRSTVRIPFTKDVSLFCRRISEERVETVFNLCESVDENPQFVGHPAAVLELMGIPFSGSSSLALMLSTDKVMTKRLLRAKGIRTPEYLVYEAPGSFHPAALRYPVIVKPRYQDASIGIDQASVFENEERLLDGIAELHKAFGTLLIEEFVGGREFNISLLGYPGAKVLPPAEIVFNGFPNGLFQIVGYRAKWDKDSFEYRHTVRQFPEDLSPALLAGLKSTAADCFRLFALRDYGRVDARIDDAGRINVLEVNANCCLSPDAGFAAAVERAGMKYSDMVIQLLNYMITRSREYVDQTCNLS